MSDSRNPRRPASATRRRFLTIVAGGFASALAGAGRTAAARETLEWRGTALGADARIILGGADPDAARATMTDALAEIERLEAIFSLYRPTSALVRLNAAGRLDPAPLELCDLIARSLRFARLTAGAFDITVQPLWELYARHFAAHPLDRAGPPAAAIAAAKARVGYRRIQVDGDSLQLEPGTRLTLNGIAQGYVTDRVAALFQARGWRNVLIDLGEFRALGGASAACPWRLELPGGGRFDLSDGAVANSSTDGFRFSANGEFHHLFDPHTGRSADGPRTVSVFAECATDADALSTALSVSPAPRWRDFIGQISGARIL